MRLFLTALNSARGGGEVHLLRLFGAAGGRSDNDDAPALWVRQKVTVCLRDADGPLTRALHDRGVRVWHLPGAASLPARVAAIRRELRAGAEPASLHINCLPRDLDYLLAACLTRTSGTVIHLHTAQYGHEAATVQGWLARLLRPVLRGLCWLAGATVLATSARAARSLFPAIAADYLWAPPIVAEGAPALPDRLCFATAAQEPIEVAFVGRLHRSAAYVEAKNVALLVQALRWIVTAARRPVRLHLVADGNALDAVLAALREAGVTVAHHRNVDRPWEVIPPHAVVVAPSRHEGFSLVVAEAQWHGRRALLSAAIPEEAVFVPELVRRMAPDAGAQQWGEAIVALAEVKEVEVRKPIRLPEPCTRLGHIALLQKVAQCG